MDNINAVVTGATRGIGLGIAKFLVNRGASISVTYHSNDQAAQAAKEVLESESKQAGNVLLLKGDGSDPKVVSEQHDIITEKFGPVTALVNNAGIMQAQKFEDISVEDWDRTIRVNLSSAFYWSRKVVPGMMAAKYGRIINVASISARGLGVVGPHYAASKAGMVGMTRYSARELGPHGITVNAIAPAFIEDAGIFTQWSDEQKQTLQEKVFVDRIGNVDDVVRAFRYLFDSPFVTGVTLDINGGVFMI
ncbi:MAG: SDR family oxidoreductase [Deltaproteobacteria bacterium]|nr:SDR family oxidoreductase [Deltaproteobacteria bacterium]